VPANRRLITHLDWSTLILSLAIAALGLLLHYGTSATGQMAFGKDIVCKQLVWLGLGLSAMGVILLIDYQHISRHAYGLYGLAIASLVAVLLVGPAINGAQRWLPLGPWRIQPSELVKPIFILALAHYCTQERRDGAGALALRHILVPLGLAGLPFWLIAKQPDLSTAMILLVILSVMLIVNGIRRRTLLGLASLGACALPVMWMLLQDYQRTRLLMLFNPQDDLLGAGYHSWQSKIAIGSGGFWGKGLFASTQSRLQFLPETHTDFIAAVLGEEMGFIGMALALVLFGLLVLHGLTIAAQARDRLGSLIATGVVTMLATQVFLNIGMTTGLIPVIGLPLPLMSYGGSSLITTCMCLGLLMNVQRRRGAF
jgi:rod shape determining protein RodA